MARLLASIRVPLMRHGFPPISVALSQRADYHVAINNVRCVLFGSNLSSDLLHAPLFRLTTVITAAESTAGHARGYRFGATAVNSAELLTIRYPREPLHQVLRLGPTGFLKASFSGP